MVSVLYLNIVGECTKIRRMVMVDVKLIGITF